MSANCTTLHALMLFFILSLLLAHDHHLFPFSKPPSTTTTKLPPTQPSSSCNCPIPAFTILLAFLSGVFFSILSLLTLRFPPFLNNLLRSCLSCIKRRRSPPPPAPTTLHRQSSNGGISDALLNTLPTFSYSAERRRRLGRGSRVCAICLSEFLNEQTLRWLPDCDHLFHRHCIDTWLASHTSCPCCRANLDNSSDETHKVEILPLDNGVNSSDGDLDVDRRFGCEGGAIGGLLRLLVGRRRQQGRRPHRR